MQNNTYTNQKKRKVLSRIVFLVFFIILSRYFYIQTITTDSFVEKASDNSLTAIKSIPPRGIIYDRNGKIIVSNRNSFSVKIYPLHYDESFDIDLFYQIINSAYKRSKLLINQNDFSDLIYKHRSRLDKKYKPMNIINFIDFKTKALLSEYKNDFPGLIFSSNPARFYPKSPKISHVLGYLRPVKRDSLKIGGYYSIDDVIGIDGIEKIYENQLRGHKGINYHMINTFGKDLGINRDKSIPSIPGQDIHLTIDYDLQLLVENLLEDLKGSIICMNPLNGEVLAMASAPDYSLSQFIGPLKKEVWQSWNEEDRLVNRSTAGTYHPGSLYKLVTSIMFIDQQLVSLDQKVFCNGKYELEDQSRPEKPQIHRCWKEEGHGEVNLHDAIVQSCNVYFYDMILKYQEKNKYIINELYNYASMLGFNKKTGIEIYEKSGRIPNSDWMVINQGKRWPKRGSMPNLSIGQGSNSVTPIQVINLINLIAMRGQTYQPKLTLNSPLKPIDSNINKYVWEEIQSAMYDVVNSDKGTAFVLRNENAIIRGKTGTAQKISSSTKEQLLSWFGGYIELDEDLISLVVLIEDTNSETKSLAKNISNKIFNYIVESEINE